MTNVRAFLIAIAGLAAACGSDTDDTAEDLTPDAAPGASFRIVSPDIAIEPGQEITYCYYTTIPVDHEVGVKRWSSQMTPGSHHLILFFADGAAQEDETIEPNCDGIGLENGVPYWMYSAQTPTAESVMPAGVGMTVPAGQKVYVQMHYLNATEETIQAHVEITADTYDTDETYQPAAAYVTYAAGFSIPANSTGSAGGSCAVPADAQFYAMSTHAHKRATLMRVTDGDAMVFESENWEHPGAALWNSDPFYGFASGQLTYHCEYDNTGNSAPVEEGASAATNEMCMAVGYFFPATGPKFCINSFPVN